MSTYRQPYTCTVIWESPASTEPQRTERVIFADCSADAMTAVHTEVLEAHDDAVILASSTKPNPTYRAGFRSR